VQAKIWSQKLRPLPKLLFTFRSFYNEGVLAMKTIKLISYNVNGIRAALKKGFDSWVEETNFDIYCLQETKAHEEQLDNDWLKKSGYHHYWFSAEKKGYSSVAIFTKTKPEEVIKGMGKKMFDSEGRSILMVFKKFALLNVYFPSGSSGEERQAIKMKFLKAFLPYAKKLKEQYKNLIICGDHNIAHHEIDIHNPKSNKKSSGFLPEERAWMTKYLEAGFTDTFRHYFITSEEMKKHLVNANILPEVKHSDHCPTYLEIKI